jgi:hypothetical protein
MDNKPHFINFQPSAGGLEFSTRNEKVQKAIEADIRFGFFIYLVYKEKEEEIAETEEIVETVEIVEIVENSQNSNAIETYAEVATTQQAKAVLREKGISIANSAPLAKVIEVAKANNIDFPNLVS